MYLLASQAQKLILSPFEKARIKKVAKIATFFYNKLFCE
ncbi:hypothetical protein J502_2614 [Acinetobacter sp. 1294596]|nr:hypothetical protein J502_2614 [Acinetobacter sp. 1294596]